VSERLWIRASLSMGTPLDLRGPQEICVRKAVDTSISLHGDPFRSEGTPENMCQKACGYKHLSPWGPL